MTRRTPPEYDADALARMQKLWEHAPGLTAAAIGERFGVSKNVVIGHASRRGWERRRPGPEPTTTIQRLDAINARMDQVLAETHRFFEDRKRVLVPGAAAE